MNSDKFPPSAGGDPAFDASVSHHARVYNYWLGGKDNISQEVRADFRNRGQSFIIAGQAPLFEKWPISRSRTFMHHYIP
ncbi:MAG: SAM-dependent methyltransferase [Trebonia sp.]